MSEDLNTTDEERNNRENSKANKKIFASLVKRDTKEKHVTVCKLIEANDALIRMVSTLKNELDEQNNKYVSVNEKNALLQRRIIELETILHEKDKIIINLQKKRR